MSPPIILRLSHFSCLFSFPRLFHPESFLQKSVYLPGLLLRPLTNQCSSSSSSYDKMLITSAPAPIDILYELRTLRPDLFSKIEIMIDGGVRSGADVVKALALGAKAVGLGRPFLYANGTHGEEGVVRVCQSMSLISF